MRLADRTDYALRVLMVLTASRERCTVPGMAESLRVSPNHLTKVVQALQAAGWVVTIPGRGGGVELATEPDRLTVGDVVRAIEPDLQLVACFRGDGLCPLEGSCRLAGALDDARAAFLGELDRVSVRDLVRGREARLVRLRPPAVRRGGSRAP